MTLKHGKDIKYPEHSAFLLYLVICCMPFLVTYILFLPFSPFLLLLLLLLLLLAQTMESQIGDIYKDVSCDLGSLQGMGLSGAPRPTAGTREGGEQSGVVETRIVRLIEPLKERRRILLASKEMHQVAQDLEDEMVSGSLLLPCPHCGPP